jgi:hypothetical protein
LVRVTSLGVSSLVFPCCIAFSFVRVPLAGSGLLGERLPECVIDHHHYGRLGQLLSDDPQEGVSTQA